jgi:hypothetical protein
VMVRGLHLKACEALDTRANLLVMCVQRISPNDQFCFQRFTLRRRSRGRVQRENAGIPEEARRLNGIERIWPHLRTSIGWSGS